MNICSTFLAIVVYSILFFCNSTFRADYQLYLATGLVILFNIINIDWLYQGHEEYVYIVVRSIAVKALSLLALFLFVRNKDDYVAYAAISSLAVCGNYLFNVVRARKYVTFQLHGLNFKRHIKPIFFFAGTLFFNSIYSKTDATMLGIIVGEESVGYYSYAHKVLQVGIGFCAAVTSAFLPRLSYYFQKDKNQFYTLVARGVQIISFLAVPAATGLFLLAPEAIVMLFGDKFLPAALTLRIFAVLIIVFAFGNLLCYQMMICTENEKKYAGILACAAVINIVLNFVLIPKFQQDGAALASVLTELFINIVVGMYFVRLLKIKFDWRAIGQATFSSGIMAISIILVKKYVKGNLLSFVCSVSIGTVIYHAICQNPKYGMVELHVQLYDKLICDGWLHGISEELLNEPAIRIKNVHGEYTTLNYSDHAIFLTIHMVKHFIGVGINLRMMLDVALYISTYRTQIDFDRFWYIMQQLHFDCVVNCVLTMMVQTGCFDWSEFPGGKVSSDDELAVFFDDLIATASDSWDHRKDSAYYEYSKAVMHQSMGHSKYCAYMIKWIFLNAKSQVWPAKEQLYALYGIEKPHPCLIPWLRLRRIVDLPMQKIWAGITPKRLLAKQQEYEEDSRLHLFKKLKMI